MEVALPLLCNSGTLRCSATFLGNILRLVSISLSQCYGERQVASSRARVRACAETKCNSDDAGAHRQACRGRAAALSDVSF